MKVTEHTEKCTEKQLGNSILQRSSMRNWRKQKGKLQNLPSKRCRLPSGGRKARATDMGEILITWIEDQRGPHLKVIRVSIQKKALSCMAAVTTSPPVGNR